VRRVGRGARSQPWAVIAAGIHLFPFRTEKLSPPAPMVLGAQAPGRVGRRPPCPKGRLVRPFAFLGCPGGANDEEVTLRPWRMERAPAVEAACQEPFAVVDARTSRLLGSTDMGVNTMPRRRSSVALASSRRASPGLGDVLAPTRRIALAGRLVQSRRAQRGDPARERRVRLEHASETLVLERIHCVERLGGG